jgi:hypothetical protein
MNATIWNQVSGERKDCTEAQADHMARNTRGEWSFKQPLPEGWDREIPRYRVQVDLHPSPLARHRREPAFVSSTDSTMYQFADRDLLAGEEISLTEWPHLSMLPLNESARQTLAYFRDHMKSRLQQTPWKNGRLRLEDGLFGPPPNASALRQTASAAAIPQPVRVAR